MTKWLIDREVNGQWYEVDTWETDDVGMNMRMTYLHNEHPDWHIRSRPMPQLGCCTFYPATMLLILIVCGILFI